MKNAVKVSLTICSIAFLVVGCLLIFKPIIMTSLSAGFMMVAWGLHVLFRTHLGDSCCQKEEVDDEEV